MNDYSEIHLERVSICMGRSNKKPQKTHTLTLYYETVNTFFRTCVNATRIEKRTANST